MITQRRRALMMANRKILPEGYTLAKRIIGINYHKTIAIASLPTAAHNFYVKFSLTDIHGGAFDAYSLVIGRNSNPQMAVYAYGWSVGNAGSTTPYPPQLNTIYEAEYNEGRYYVDGQDTGISRAGTMYFNLFGETFSMAGSIYKAHIIDNLTGNKIVDIYPCFRDSDNEGGFYDIVNNAFYPAINGHFGYERLDGTIVQPI